MQLSEIKKVLEKFAPLPLQEDYDNAGLIIGSPDLEIHKVMISLDVTETVLDEAIAKGCNLIVSHHPLIFKGIKKLNLQGAVDRMVVKAIKNDIAIYAMHTNLDNVHNGVNAYLCRAIGLKNCRILKTGDNLLSKLVTFCPESHADSVRNALFNAGCGQIGNYDSCSFNVDGKGSFRALEGANPFVGNKNQLHYEKEVRIETIFPSYNKIKVTEALIASHPYEEVAYDIYPLENKHPYIGAGMIGELENAQDETDFLKEVKKKLNLSVIRHTPLSGKKIKKVAICGGSGSFLIHEALTTGADVFLTGDIKYHDFFITEKRMLLADIGHYESEQFTKELIFAILQENFPTFAVQISEAEENPVNYL